MFFEEVVADVKHDAKMSDPSNIHGDCAEPYSSALTTANSCG